MIPHSRRRSAATGPHFASACLPLALALVTGLCLATLATPAEAQARYEWADENGRKVYSDVPPPPGSRVTQLTLRGERQPPEAPSRVPGAEATAQPAAHGSADAETGQTAEGKPTTTAAIHSAAGSAGGKPPSVADKEMAFRKRQAEQAEAEQKQLAKAQEDRRQAQACDDGKASLRSLESGQRVSRTNESGEREFISDAERDNRIRQLRDDLANRC